MIRRILTVVALLVPVLVYSGTTGKISGVVTNQATGDPMIGVNIIVEGTVLGAATSSEGYYTILNVPVGTYTLRASYIGYAEVVTQNVTVSADLTTKLDISMETTAIAGAEVVVIAERPMIRRDATNTNIIRSGEEIDALPTRGLQAIASQIAGVVREEGETELNIRGGRGEESAIYIDGVFVNDPYNYAVRINLPNEAIEEMSVQTGGFNAEYGEAMSGILIITTNSGTDRYSGSFEAISDGFLSDTKKTLGTYGYGYNEYVFTLGGPIIPRTKHTFFISASQRNQADRTPSWGWAENENKPGDYEYAYLHPDSLQAGVRDTLWTKAFDFTSAQIPGNTGEDLNYTAKIKLQLANTMELKSSIIGTKQINMLGDPMSVYRPETVQELTSDTKAMNVTFTHAPSPNMFYDLKFNYFDTFRQEAIAAFGDEIYWYGDPTKSPIANEWDVPLTDSASAAQLIHPYGEAHTARINEPDYFAPGGHYGFGGDNYFKNRTSYWGIDFDLTYQLGKYHTFKTGAEYKYHTMRYFYIISPEKLMSTADLTEIEKWRLADIQFYGYDLEGNEVDEGDYLNDVVRDDLTGDVLSGFDAQAPYHPIIASGYLQDKIEFKDLILNVGVRYDRIDPNAWQFKQLEATYDDDDNYVSGGMFAGDDNKDEIFGLEDTKESEVHTYISPRLGVSFPVTDRTIFHAQYGVFYQPPRLGDLYLSPFYLDRMANAGGYFTALDNPNLEPPKTTSYEVGFQQRLGEYAALQLSAFYKETEGLTQVLNVMSDLTTLAFRRNGDFGTVKGFDVILTLSRFKNLYATFNYEFQRATGTGSSDLTNYDIAWQTRAGYEGYPKFTMPLDFEQRHTGALNVDYRLKNTSLNMLFTFTSGNPYTRMKIFNTVPHTGRYDNDRVSETPISAVNAVNAPWTNRLDLRVDQSIPLGPASVSVYLWVLNVLNTRNVKDVWITTGLADDTGYTTTSSGKAYLEGASELEKANFQMREMDYNNYGIPRQIRLGVKVAF